MVRLVENLLRFYKNIANFLPLLHKLFIELRVRAEKFNCEFSTHEARLHFMCQKKYCTNEPKASKLKQEKVNFLFKDREILIKLPDNARKKGVA
jgi:hypothetical protein